MANLKEVRTRIGSVSSTQQITSAMKMVSAAKFRRAQNAIIGMRPYAAQLDEIVSDIDTGGEVLTPYHAVRPPKNVLLVVVTSNKGLCGAFNSNVIKQATARIEHYTNLLPEDGELRVMSIGKKSSELLARRNDIALTVNDDLLDNATFDAVAEVADGIMNAFANKEIDLVEVVYNQFKNSLSQVLSTDQLLPLIPNTQKNRSNQNNQNIQTIQSTQTTQTAQRNDYIYEPSKEDIVRSMVPLMLRSTFYRMLLDSLASEHGARMTAMQKATDNATELLKDLRLSYNKARQAAITNEIIEIVSGSEALKG
ncbi:MAG: ATP synthase F1 subunit gamma [Bacteroidales bacterium]|nr:ATP synthase F1 subunit gamma [Bacteroidales bacterium]